MLKKVIKSFGTIFFILITGIISVITYYKHTLPEIFYASEDDKPFLNLFPFSVSTLQDSSCTNLNIQKVGNSHPNLNVGYQAKLKFLNILPIKTVQVHVVPKKQVTPCGTPFGVKIRTQGVMIIEISDVMTDKGLISPAKNAGLQKGDIITEIDNKSISSNEDLEQALQDSKENIINLSIMRNEQLMNVSLKPIKSCDDEKYRAGIWVRDSSAGIGTLTFIDSDTNTFAGLGHGICDIDTGKVLSVAKGEIVKAFISNIKRGKIGFPGELKGHFIDSESIGTLCENNNIGLYGVIKHPVTNSHTIDIGMKQHVKKGPAKILTTINGTEPSYYDINIDSINYNTNCPTKNIKITVTDPILIEKTGGIVQGMSGSPIIQNGMLIGAVTHVFINNPSKGYAIFAETMMTNSNKVFDFKYKKAS